MTSLKRTPRLIAGLCCTALIFAAGGCGDDGETSGPPSDEAQLRQLVQDYQDDFIARDGEGLCSKLTRGGQREVERFGVAIGHVEDGTSCADAVRAVSKGADNIEQDRSRTVSVEVQGDRATLMVSDGGRPAVPTRAVRVGGVWKLRDAGVSAATPGS